MHSLALYFFNDLCGRRLHLYVHMINRYPVFGGRFIFGMNLKVPIPVSPSISVLGLQRTCARQPVVLFVRLLVHLGFAFAYRKRLD
jgi:hypothetical protein